MSISLDDLERVTKIRVEKMPRCILSLSRSRIYWPLLCSYLIIKLGSSVGFIGWAALCVALALYVPYPWALHLYEEEINSKVEIKRKTANNLKCSFDEYAMLLGQTDVWQKAREAGVEKKMLTLSKDILDLIAKLRGEE